MPLRTAWQIPLETVLRVDEATWHHDYIDYWGTQVRAFEAQNPHRVLTVEATSLVEVDDAGRPQPRLDMGWDDLASQPVGDRFAELLTQTARTVPDPEVIAMARECADAGSPHDAALALCTRVHELMSYRPGSTGVHTTAQEAWRARSGVCQDYVHLVVGALRCIGVPARYVSGYLHPRRSAQIGETVSGQSHAWVEWWLGEWTGHDPTNNSPVSERHVVIGGGRDYNDVPPITGIIAGSGGTELTVSVDITRLT